MSLTYRFYVSALTGTGTRADPRMSRVMRMCIDAAAITGSASVNDMMNAATLFRFTAAFVDSTMHALLAADANVRALSPELADASAVNTWLDGLVTSLPGALSTMMENAGIPVDWISGTTTRLDFSALADQIIQTWCPSLAAR